MNQSDILKHTQQWLEEIVIGLQLCPFAKKPFSQKTIRYSLSDAKNDEERIAELITECETLDKDSGIETSLIIYSKGLSDFFDYTQLLDWANSTLKRHNWQGVYQIASFQPDYVFTNSQACDRDNLTNRAPYPIIHLLRESSLEAAIEQFPDTDTIVEKNIATMNNLTESDIKRLFHYLTIVD